MRKQIFLCLVISLIACVALILVVKSKGVESREANELSEEDYGKLIAFRGRVASVSETRFGVSWYVCSRKCVNVYTPNEVYREYSTRFDASGVKGKRVLVQGIYGENGLRVFDANGVDVTG